MLHGGSGGAFCFGWNVAFQMFVSACHASISSVHTHWCVKKEGTPMKRTEFRKQLSIFVPISEWRAIRAEAARRNIPMTQLCLSWMRPEIKRLKPEPPL